MNRQQNRVQLKKASV
ncbi:MAG: hypothetical protein HOJ51_13020 [Tateyamaria sp.]|nr:hypothetical protein [Tateyamaria sp.]